MGLDDEKSRKPRSGMRALVALIILVVAAYIYWSPYETLHEIRKDLKVGQLDQLEQLIDYTSVRDGLKRDFHSMALEQVEESASIKNKLLGVLGLAFGQHVSEPVIDYIVSPAGLRDVVSGVVPVFSHITIDINIGGGSDDHAQETHSSSQSAAPADPVKSTEGRYVDFNIFIATIKSKKGSATALTFTRRGLMSWQLTHIRLMPEN